MPIQVGKQAWMDDYMEKSSSHGDRDLGRSEEEQSRDRMLGDFGECVVKQYLEYVGNEVKFSDTYKYDLLVNGNIKIDVKTRKGWKKYRDLLIRYPDNLYSDYYIQVIGKRESADPLKFKFGNITGYATKEECENADIFNKGHGNKAIVPQEELHPIEDLSFVPENYSNR